MDDKEVLKRKIKLKGQAIELFKAERTKMRFKLALMKWEESLEAQIGKEFNSALSKKLECLTYLLDG